MGCMIHLAYKSSTGGGVASPVDGPQHTTWPLDDWAAMMPRLMQHGLTVPVLAPMTKGATLGAGYDPYDHYDLGSKLQSGRRETRYGDVERAMRFVAICRALGMEVYANVVHHHVDGDSGDFVYQYPGADGHTRNGRFPKDRHCFTHTWPNPDSVPDPAWDIPFGREFLWNTGFYGDGVGDNGPGYVRRNLAQALDWQTRRLGVEGYFLDDVKGTNANYIGYLLNRDAMADKVAFGEYSDGNTNTLINWMHGQDLNGRCGVLDFALRYKIRDVLNHGHDMRVILSEGVCWRDPARAITFIENADLDLSDPIIWSKLLGHAMLATFPGYPMFFGKDLYPGPVGYGLMEPTLNLMWIHETFSKGDLWWRDTTADHLIYERAGDATSPGCITGVTKRIGQHSNPADWRAVRVQTKWINTHLHDYTGFSDDQWTDSRGMMTMWLPPNENGRGFCIFAPVGINNPINLPPRRTTQEIWGAVDLDTPPVTNNPTTIGKIWLRTGSTVFASINADKIGWSDQSGVEMALINPANRVIPFVPTTDPAQPLACQITEGQWHRVQITGHNLPLNGSPFKTTLRYYAPRAFSQEMF